MRKNCFLDSEPRPPVTARDAKGMRRHESACRLSAVQGFVHEKPFVLHICISHVRA